MSQFLRVFACGLIALKRLLAITHLTCFVAATVGLATPAESSAAPILDLTVWMLPSTSTEERWLEIHRIDDKGPVTLYHISILSKPKRAPSWQLKHVMKHMAITEAALRNSPLRAAPKMHQSYPESYDDGYSQWLKLDSQGVAPVCTTSVMECAFP